MQQYLLKFRLPIFFPLVDGFEAIGERGDDTCRCSFECDGLPFKVHTTQI